MSRIKLTVDGEERNVLFFSTDYFHPDPLDRVWVPRELLELYKRFGTVDADYEQPYFRTLKDFDRHSPRAYRAHGQPFGGLFRIVMESTGSDDLFYHWFKTTRATHGMLEFYNSKDEDLPFRRLEFWDGWISELSETMASAGSIPMLLCCEISPATVRYNKSLVFQKNWFITDINQKQVKEKSDEKEIISVQWIDRDTQKEKKQIVSDEWAGLKIETGNFEKGDEIKITIKEVNGKLLEKGKSAIESSEKAGSDDVLIIKKAFKFSKAETNINREVSVTVSSAEASKSGENTLKENNGGIWGTKNTDTLKVIRDIKQVFSDHRFASFNALVMPDSQNNKRIANIDEDALSAILQNPLLNDDDKLAVEIVSNTVNSTYTYLVQFAKIAEPLSGEAAKQIKITTEAQQLLQETNTPLLSGFFDGSVTKSTEKGSFSLIIEDDKLPNDYYNSNTKIVGVVNAVGHPILSLHEVMGHGRSLSLGRGEAHQHEDAILFENLLLRIMGYSYIQRTGKDHGTKVIISNPSKKPEYR